MILYFIFHFYNVRVETVWVGKGSQNWNRLRKAGTWSWIFAPNESGLELVADMFTQEIQKNIRLARYTPKVIVLPEPKMSVSHYSSAVSKRLKYLCFFLHWPTLMPITYHCHCVMPFTSSSGSLRVKVFRPDVDESKYMIYYNGIPFFFSLFFKVVGKWMYKYIQY